MSSSTTIRTRWISATLSIPSFCRNTLSICSLSYSCSLAARCQALLSIFLCYVSKCLIKVLIFNTKNMILFYFDKILNQRKIAYHVWRYSKRPRGMTKVFLGFFYIVYKLFRRGFTILRRSWIATHSTLQCTKDGPRWPFTSCRFSTICTQWSTSWSLTNSANCEHHYCHVQIDKPTTFLGYNILYNRPVVWINLNQNSCFLPLFVFVHISSKIFPFFFQRQTSTAVFKDSLISPYLHLEQ